MALVLHPLMLAPLAACVLAGFFAVVMGRTRPRTGLHRSLAIVLAGEALIPVFFLGQALLEDAPGRTAPLESALWAGILLTMAMLPWAYLLFLSYLPSPVVKWLGRPATRRAIRAVLLATPLVMFALVATNFELAGEAPAAFDALLTFFMIAEVVAAFTAAILGLLAAIDLYRRARSPATRAQARAFVLAFGLRDTLVLVALLLGVSAIFLTRGTEMFLGFLVVGGLVLTYVPFLAYGVLRTQLFDIDLRLRWTLSHGTVGAVIAALAIGVGEIVINLSSNQIGVVAGGLTAAGLLLVARPLQRLADRAAGRVMPHTADREGHVSLRKREVYEAAVEGALTDGSITFRERNVLAALQDRLGLTAKEALGIEKGLQARLTAQGQAPAAR